MFLLAGLRIREDDRNGVARALTEQADQFSREIENSDRLTIIQDKHLAALTHGTGLQDEQHGL